MFVLLLLALTLVVPSTLQAAPWWNQSINVESKVGTDRSIQSLDVMYPITHSDDSLLFTDLRGRLDDDDSVELNLGLAQRFVAPNPIGGLVPGVDTSDEAVLGYYGFADRLESQYDNTFYQATAGFEYFTKDYSLRVNGYLPQDERKPTTSFTQLQATGTQIFFEDRQNYERPLPGYDAELGRTFRFDGWQLYGRGSYFRFHHSDAAEIEGERFRTGVQFDGSHPEVYLPEDSQLTLGVEWQNDSVRDEQTFGIARVSVPFGTVENQKSNIEKDNSEPSTLNSELRSWKQDRLTERISRDVDVVTGKDEFSGALADTRPAEVASTGQSLSDVALARGSASDSGSLENPGDLSTAVDRAGTDGVVFVSSAGGTLATSGVVLPGGQALYGTQTPLRVRTPDGEVSEILRLGSERPTIEGSTADPTIQLDTGTAGQTIRGLAFTGGMNAVRADDVDTLTIDNVTVEHTGGDAIRLSDVDNATIKNSSIRGTLNAGDTFGGRIATSRVGALAIGRDATGRVEDVSVRSGSLTVGDDAGRGAGNRFALRRVAVESGNLRIGENAGAENGTLRMDTVTVADGFLELDDHAAGDPTDSNNGGMATLTNITTGDSLSVGAGAGIENGSFTMKQVRSGGTVTIDPSAGEHGGSFTMEDLSSDGILEIGSTAGANNGSFTMTEVSSAGGLEIGANAARSDGSFSIADVTLDTGDMTIGEGAGSDAGEFTMDTVAINNGFLDIGDQAGGPDPNPSTTSAGGHFEMSHVDVGDSLSIGNDAGRDGSFSMAEVDISHGLSVRGNAGYDSGVFSMADVDVADSFSIGERAGDNNGSFSMSGVTVDSGNLSVGDTAGALGGSFSMLDVILETGDLTIGNSAGSINGEFTMDTVAINNGFLDIGEQAGGAHPTLSTAGGYFEMNRVDVGDSVSVGNNAGSDGGIFDMNDVEVGKGLSVGRNAGRIDGSFAMKRVEVGTGVTVGREAGRNGGSFAMERVGVASGDLEIGDNAGAENGTLRMDTVTVADGFLELGDNAAGDPTGSGNGGMATLTNIATGNSLSIGAGAGIENGSFTMTDVTSDGTLYIGENAGRNTGSFTMEDVEVVDGNLEVRDHAGRDTGTFEMTDVKVKRGDLTLGDHAGQLNGELLMDSVTVKTGDFVMGNQAGAGSWDDENGGFASLTDIDVGGSLRIEEQAGARAGTFEMSDVRAEGGLTILGGGSDPAGSFEMSDVSVMNGFSVTQWGGGYYGSFEMNNVTVSSGDLEIEELGNDTGTATLTDITVSSGDLYMSGGGNRNGELLMDTVEVENGSLEIEELGNDTGTATLTDIDVDSLSMGPGDYDAIGQNGGDVSLLSSTIRTGDLSVGPDAAVDGGSLLIEGNEVREGDIVVDSTGANASGITCRDNTMLNGAVNCPTP